jgi:predicted house-cleaning noncanonical NTP pyrophosphatase (MazG superfamily)
MMHREKLVRNDIPGIVLKQDPSAVIQVRTAHAGEILQLLLDKLDEEFTELKQALYNYADPNSDSKEPPFASVILEAADVVEVVRALMDYEGVDPAELERIRKSRVESRGSFSQRLVMAQWKSEHNSQTSEE